MQKVRHWGGLFAILLIVAGQTTYACDTMDLPAQPSCCCDEATARSDTATLSDEDCDHSQAGPFCCSVEYNSPAKGAITGALSPDKAPTSLSVVALGPGPSLEDLLPLHTVLRSIHANDRLLLEQAATGRIVYLSTRRLRI